MKPWLVWAIAVGGLGALAMGVIAVVMIGPRNLWGMMRYDQRHEGKLRVGDPPPDVALMALDGTTRVHLRERMGAKPTVLIFGSYT